jgi:tRNA-dihydrouridine synthase A
MARLSAAGVPWGHASRHMLGLRNGQPGARRWRQVWSDSRYKSGPPEVAQRAALAARLATASRPTVNPIQLAGVTP